MTKALNQRLVEMGGGGNFDVNSFCDAHKISRALFYQLLKKGNGPRIIKLGKRTLISYEAAAEWRRQLESA